MQAILEQKQKILTYPQDKFIFCQDHFVCIKGTWGCGKSLAGLYAANRECEEYSNNLYMIVRKEFCDMRDSTLKDWNTEIGRPIINNEVRYSNGSILMFRHGGDFNLEKNVNLGGVLLVQGEELNEDDFWWLEGRLRRKEGTRQLRIECNYDGHNYIYKLFNIQKIGTLILTNTFDNEINLPVDYIPRLRKMPKKLQDRYLFGTDADMEGRVLDEFSRDKNVKNPFYIPVEWNRIVILDHGFTNPTAVLWAAVDWDGKIFIYDEHFEAGKVISYHAEQIKLRDNSNVIKWLIDPSCASKTQEKKYDDGRIELHSIIDEYQEYGIRFEPADNTVLAGINNVNEAFKNDTLIIFKNCENTIREVENWKWKKLKPGINRNTPEEPMDKDDHTCADLRYLMNSRIAKSDFKNNIPLSLISPLYKMQELKRKREEVIH